MIRVVLLTGAALVALAPAAHATLIVNASLFNSQALPGTATTVDLGGVSLGSLSTVAGAGYTIGFVGTAADQGVVQGTVTSRHAVPVAGSLDGAEGYLTGARGSALTPSRAASGNYLSSGGQGSSVVITFTAPQTSLALLWGSVDAGNRLAFNNASGDVLVGAAIQDIADGFVADGFQGMGGSAYVTVSADTPFSQVTLSSDVISFEAAGLVASALPLQVPEPMSLALLGMGLAGLSTLRRRA